MEHKEAKSWLCDFVMFCRGAFHSQEEKDRFNKMSEWIISVLTEGKASWKGILPAERIVALEAENAALKKRLECPQVEWDNYQRAKVAGKQIGIIDWYNFPKRKFNARFLEVVVYDATSPSDDLSLEVWKAKAAVESAWRELWNKLTGEGK